MAGSLDPGVIGEGGTPSGASTSGPSLLGWVVGIVFLGGLIALTHYSVGWSTLLIPWTRVGRGSLVLAMTLVLASYAVRGLRIHWYFHPSTAGRFPATFRLVLLHNLLNNLLPMRSGEASFPILMSRQFGVPYARSIPALVYLRVLDLHFVILLGVVVLSLARGSPPWIVAGLLAPLPYGIFLIQGSLDRWLEARKGRWHALARRGLGGLPSSPVLFWTVWFWTVVNWSVKLLVLAWILRAFFPMPFSSAFVGTTTGELSSVLPFHGIAGAGTYEAGVLAGLLPLGVPLDGAVQAAVNLHLFLLGLSILAGVLGALLPGRVARSGGRAEDS